MSSKTKNVIVEAFLDLLNEKEFTKISITDITEKCNASRQTFYYHFDNIDDMLKWAFKEQTKISCARISPATNWIDSIEPYATFLSKYTKLISSAINSECCLTILDLLKDSFYEFYKSYLEATTNIKLAEKDDFFVNCCASSMVCYVIREVKKENPNYHNMNNELYKLIKQYGLAK